MLIDTGATASALSKRTADRLGLPLVGQRILQSVNHVGPVNLYLADLSIVAADPPRRFDDFCLIELELNDEPVDGLIGLDIIQHGVLQMDGPQEQFSLVFKTSR